MDLNKFTPRSSSEFPGKRVILGVASIWDDNKGLGDFKSLQALLHENELLVIVGLNKKQLEELPEGIIGIERTSNVEELIALYSRADCFFNLSYADSFPTTIMEAMACGTQVITYATGGCVEMVKNTLGQIVPKGNYEAALLAFRTMLGEHEKGTLKKDARAHAERHFDFNRQVNAYLELYDDLTRIM